MRILRFLIVVLLAQVAVSAQFSSASIEGIVVKLGTNEPVTGADVELTRVEGTAAAPLPPGAAEVLARMLIGGGNEASAVPPAIASEVKYFKTRSDGKFSFRDLKEGKYRLVSAHTSGAFQPAEFGQRDPRGRGLNFPVTVGQAMKDVKLEMAPTGAISGRVTDADGQPMGHVRVEALVPSVQDGRRYLAIVQALHTDEHGDYRLFWLSPGRYYVAAKVDDLQRRTLPTTVVPPGRTLTSENASSPIVVRRRLPSGEVVEETAALVYNGGVLDPDQARPLELIPGTTLNGIDIPMAAGKMRAWHIRGVVMGPAGQPAPGASVIAVPRQWSPSILVLNATTNAKGEFDLAGAVTGSYALFASTSTSGTISPELAAAAAAAGVDLESLPVQSRAQLMGVETASVGYVSLDINNADADNIRIATTAGINLQGRVSIEGRAENDPGLEKIRVGLRRDPDILMMPGAMIPLPPLPPGTAATSRPENGQVLADGKFNILAAPGEFRVTTTGIPANLYVKSIRMGNVELNEGGLRVNRPPDNPIEIVLGSDAGEISGTVSNSNAAPLPNVVVALVPESPLLRRRIDLYRNATTDAAGRFRLETVPPGSYKLFSWEYVDNNAWQDAQFLQTYETYGKSITVREGSRQETSLNVIAVRR